eukprot:GGOE01002761.1.p4 GENE.GGOE01002761.1~~GGOE01002761.1.p4  ORF type:complete len:130 (+),score=14.75 GGOE01002761.1:212-601(+)
MANGGRPEEGGQALEKKKDKGRREPRPKRGKGPTNKAVEWTVDPREVGECGVGGGALALVAGETCVCRLAYGATMRQGARHPGNAWRDGHSGVGGADPPLAGRRVVWWEVGVGELLATVREWREREGGQ